PNGTVAADEGPREVGPGTWEAPPVRGSDGEAVTSTVAASPLSAPAPASGQRGRRRFLIVLAAMVIVLGGIVVVGLWKVESSRIDNEIDRSRRALELYDQGEFAT